MRLSTELVAFSYVALMVAVLAGLTWRLHRRRKRYGPAAVGAMDELLHEDRRKAVEIIVEQRAEERRPEYPDGNLPELEIARTPAREVELIEILRSGLSRAPL